MQTQRINKKYQKVYSMKQKIILYITYRNNNKINIESCYKIVNLMSHIIEYKLNIFFKKLHQIGFKVKISICLNVRLFYLIKCEIV